MDFVRKISSRHERGIGSATKNDGLPAVVASRRWTGQLTSNEKGSSQQLKTAIDPF